MSMSGCVFRECVSSGLCACINESSGVCVTVYGVVCGYCGLRVGLCM